MPRLAIGRNLARRARAQFFPVALTALFVSCAGEAGEPSAAARPAIHPDGRSFAVDGKACFLLGRTPTAKTREGFLKQFDEACAAGETVLRITLHHGVGSSIQRKPAGTLDPEWLAVWDGLFEEAAKRGLFILPVFSGHAQWKDQSAPGYFKAWEQNPYNKAMGGPAASPAEFFADTPCQRLFLDWVGRAVAHFRKHANIMGWEAFTEIDLPAVANRIDRADAVRTIERISAAIRANDPEKRPVTASLSGVVEWPELWKSPAVDFLQIHPYPGKRNGYDLMGMILERVPALARYGKPVIIGEEGLHPWDDPDVNLHPRAMIAYRQAAWSAMASGASLGGMYWFLSGYGGGELTGKHQDLLKPVATFAGKLDLSGMKNVPIECRGGIRGAVLAGPAGAAGYVADSACVAPEWPSRPVRGGSVSFPSEGGTFTRVEFYDPRTGEGKGKASARRTDGGALLLDLPEFSEDLAFLLR